MVASGSPLTVTVTLCVDESARQPFASVNSIVILSPLETESASEGSEEKVIVLSVVLD